MLSMSDFGLAVVIGFALLVGLVWEVLIYVGM